MLERGVHLVQDTPDKLTFSAKPSGTLHKNKANVSPQQESGLGPDYWLHGVRDVMEKEERGHVAAGTAAAPEMTGGDLLNAALS